MLYQLSYIGLRAFGASADKSAQPRSSLPACHPKLGSKFIAERRMERETGIEPATNSLEGCDSTTELLPPSRLTRFASRRFGGQARLPYTPCLLRDAALPWLAIRSSPRERRMVARKGFEPSKPLGRQIYSLLRLTASLPRPNSSAGCRLLVPPHRTFQAASPIATKAAPTFPTAISLEREKFRATVTVRRGS